jgi:hypothetical protein
MRQIGPLDADRVRLFMTEAREHYGDCVKDIPPQALSAAAA